MTTTSHTQAPARHPNSDGQALEATIPIIVATVAVAPDPSRGPYIQCNISKHDSLSQHYSCSPLSPVAHCSSSTQLKVGVTVNACEGKEVAAPAPAKPEPGAAAGVDGQTPPADGLQSGVRFNSLQDALEEERAFIFKWSFPKAELLPNSCWEIARASRSDLNLQLNHLAYHDTDTQGLLSTLYRKVTLVRKDGGPGYWNNQAAWDRYDARACLIVTSHYERRKSFCLCGVRKHDGKNSSCQDITFCPRCNFHRRLGPIQKEFGHCFSAAPEVYFITLGMGKAGASEPCLVFKELTDQAWYDEVIPDGCCRPFETGIRTYSGSPDFEGCQQVFQAGREALNEMVEGGSLSGHFGAPELAVGFLPLRILPHVHAVAFSDGFTLTDAQEVLRAYEQRLTVLRDTGVIPPSIVANVLILRVPSPGDYGKILKYCFKPLKVEQAFHYATLRCDGRKDEMNRLGTEVEDFFEVVGMVFSRVHRVMRKGICAAKSAGYCGLATRERLAKRLKEKARRRRKREAIMRFRQNEG